MIEINKAKQKIVVGVDIGGTNTAVGIIDFNKNFIFEDSFLTEPEEGIEKFVNRLAKQIKVIYSKYSSTYILEGIGIAAPGANYLTGILESPANLKWGNVPMIDMMKEYFEIPIILINDAQAAALGEMEFGCAKEMKNFLVLTLGTGFGSGIVINGQLLYGENGHAGEIGHTIVEKKGRQCNCGNKGCLETYVSATGIKRTVLDFLHRYKDESELRNIESKNISAKLISQLALQHDSIALKAFDYTGKILGIALANMVTYFDPQAIILTGGLVEADGLLLKPAREYFKKSLLGIYNGRVQILKSSVQNNLAGLLGACSYILKNINNNQEHPVLCAEFAK